MPKFEYSYQNLSLVNIKGERWKDVPKLEGYFMVSNLGRIKRLTYEMTYKNGAVYTKEAKIIKPRFVCAKNHFVNDTVRFLTVRLTADGSRHSFTLSRLVYYCFVKKFNLTDKATIILNKDFNTLNVLPNNLIKSTLSDRMLRIFKRSRMDSPFNHISDEVKKKRLDALVKKKRKEVTQYSIKGKKIKTYKSLGEAQRATGIFASIIGNRAGGKGLTAGGYVWRFGKAPSVDVDTLKKDKQAAHRKKHGQKVTQYDGEGNRVAMFNSLQDAQLATGANPNAIRLVLKGVYKSAKGYIWKKGFGKPTISFKNYKWGRESIIATQSKKVKQFTLDGEYLKTYASLKEAALAVNANRSQISQACRGKSKYAKGFKWKFV